MIVYYPAPPILVAGAPTVLIGGYVVVIPIFSPNPVGIAGIILVA